MNDGFFLFRRRGKGKFPAIGDSSGEAEEQRRDNSRKRFQQLQARRQLLTNVGGAFQWSDNFKDDAALLTLTSVERLFFSQVLEWKGVQQGALASVSSNMRGTSGPCITPEIAVAAWGRDSFVVRARILVDAGGLVLNDVLSMIRDERPKWDRRCAGVDVIEEGRDFTQFNIVRFKVRLPSDIACFACVFGCSFRRNIDFTFLQAWEFRDESLVFASRSVKYPDTRPNRELLPSGWLVKAVDGGKFDIRYVVEMERAQISKWGPDALLHKFAARLAVGELRHLTSYMQRNQVGNQHKTLI